jgi:hypothetical protein
MNRQVDHLTPSSDPSFQFWSLLAEVEGAAFHKEEPEYMQWRHTECSDAEDDMSICYSINKVIGNMNPSVYQFKMAPSSIREEKAFVYNSGVPYYVG